MLQLMARKCIFESLCLPTEGFLVANLGEYNQKPHVGYQNDWLWFMYFLKNELQQVTGWTSFLLVSST